MPYLTLNDPISSGNSREYKAATHPTTPEASEPTGVIGSDIVAHGTEYPLVKLDTEVITDATAARLATSLLGHVLFLKNQIPLPVMQLARISNAKTNPRALKQRQDLLNSFDTLSSHLETTFSALSTALARSRSNREIPLAQAYLAFLVGPGIRTAKAKVVLGIDGLEKRIWGSWDESRSSGTADNGGPDSEGDTDTDGDESELNEVGEEPEESGDEDQGSSDDENISNSSDDSDADPSHCDSDADKLHHDSDADPLHRDFVEPIHVSRAEEQRFLQNAERLLSRVLANADANGKGMISEMAPTHMHIFIRAPRRFVHPAWVPSPNVNAVLDGALDTFLRGSERCEVPNVPMQRPSKVPKVEGVWITTRPGLQKFLCPPLLEEKKCTISEEGDDLIWWSWDGKLLGFADW